MIVKTKTGVQVSGTLAREPEIKQMGGKDVLKLSVKAQSEKGADGKWNSLFVDVLCWDALSERDGMFQKGDFVTAEGREIKSREYPEGSGKVYYSLRADGLTPGDLVVFRWMQMVIDMTAQAYAAPAEPVPVDEPTPFDEAPTAPVSPTAQQQAPQQMGFGTQSQRQQWQAAEPSPGAVQVSYSAGTDDDFAELDDLDDLPFLIQR